MGKLLQIDFETKSFNDSEKLSIGVSVNKWIYTISFIF